MPEIGLFPLGMVLLPTERVPLHIFEPRYRELISESLAEEREFGLLYAEEGDLRRIGTRARVADVLEVFDDGRMNVLIEGGERFRLLELTSGRSFHTGTIEAVVDEDGDSPEDDRERALGLFRRLVEETQSEMDEPDARSPLLSFELAARVEFAPDAKQQLLELRSEAERITRVIELLESAIATVELARAQREAASRNGRVAYE